MKQIHRTYEIRLVTPAFLAGADQQAPELRVPSIRGSLRWWFRLAQFGAGKEPEQIRNEESELFGSIGQGQKLVLRIRRDAAIKQESIRYQDLPFDHQYLWFPLRPQKGSTGSIARPALASGTIFKVEAIVRSTEDGAEVIKQLNSVISHWVLFGSIGMRSRRCAGSLWFSSSLLSGDKLPTGREDILKTLDASKGTLPIDFDVSPEAFDDWKETVKDVGNHYRGRRIQIKDSKGRKALPALGWPIMKYPGAKNNKIEVDGHESERLASPILLKVIPDGQKFRWLLVVIKEPFVERVRSGEGEVRVRDIVDGFKVGFEKATAPPPNSRGRSGGGRRR